MKSQSNLYISGLLLCLFLFSCTAETNDMLDNPQREEMNTRLEHEMQYIRQHYKELDIQRIVTTEGKTERYPMDTTGLRKALYTVYNLEAGRIADNPSYALDSTLEYEDGTTVLKKTYHVKEGEKLPFKYLTITKKGKQGQALQYAAIAFVRQSENTLFSSTEEYFLEFREDHLRAIHVDINEKVAFFKPDHFAMQIEINKR